MTVNEWIGLWRAKGYWCSRCPSCGWWYAQEHKGRRSIICEKARCDRWNYYRNRNGRAPPEWLLLKWKEMYGDSARRASPKKNPGPTFQETAA